MDHGEDTTKSQLNAPDVKAEFDRVKDGHQPPPSKPKTTLELTLGGTIEQTVHTDVEKAKAASRQTNREPAGGSYKKHMLLKREFNRAARDGRGR